MAPFTDATESENNWCDSMSQVSSGSNWWDATGAHWQSWKQWSSKADWAEQLRDLDRESGFSWQGTWGTTSSWGCPQSTNDSQWGRWYNDADGVPDTEVSVFGHTQWQDSKTEVDQRCSPVVDHQWEARSDAGCPQWPNNSQRGCWRNSVDDVRGTGVSVSGHTKRRDCKTEVDRRWNPVAGHESKTGSNAVVAVFGPAKEKKSAEVLNSKQKRNQHRLKKLAQKKGDGEVWSKKRSDLWTAVSAVLGHDAPKEVDVLVGLGKTLAFHCSGLVGPDAAFEVNTNVSAELTRECTAEGDRRIRLKTALHQTTEVTVSEAQFERLGVDGLVALAAKKTQEALADVARDADTVATSVHNALQGRLESEQKGLVNLKGYKLTEKTLQKHTACHKQRFQSSCDASLVVSREEQEPAVAWGEDSNKRSKRESWWYQRRTWSSSSEDKEASEAGEQRTMPWKADATFEDNKGKVENCSNGVASTDAPNTKDALTSFHEVSLATCQAQRAYLGRRVLETGVTEQPFGKPLEHLVPNSELLRATKAGLANGTVYGFLPEGGVLFTKAPSSDVDGWYRLDKSMKKKTSAKIEWKSGRNLIRSWGKRAPEEVDYYTRGPLDEMEWTTDWAPQEFLELPVMLPLSAETLAGTLHLKFRLLPVTEDFRRLELQGPHGCVDSLILTSFQIEAGVAWMPSANSPESPGVQWSLRCVVCGSHVSVYEKLKNGVFFEKLAKNTLKDLVHRVPESKTQLIQHLSAKSHLSQWVNMGDFLTAAMGVIKNNGSRHYSATRTQVTPLRTVVNSRMLPGRAREGAHLPTVDDCLRSLGELRGLAVLLFQAISEGRAYFQDPNDGTLMNLEKEEVDTLTPGIVLWSSDEIADQYRSGANRFIAAQQLPENGFDYHSKVVGLMPSHVVPNPASILHDYVQFEVDCNKVPPASYVPLATKKMDRLWPKEAKDWPSKSNIEMMRLLPPGDDDKSWYGLIQVQPKLNTRLSKVLGWRWIGYCKVQIVIIDSIGRVVGWVNHYQCTEPRQELYSLAEQVANEFHG